MRKKPAKPQTDTLPDRKTVGVPMARADLEALRAYRDAEGLRAMVVPREGPAALAIFRAGLRALSLGGAS